MFSLPFLEKLTSYLSVTALDDAIDILSCLITSFVYIVSALLIKLDAGTNIECWTPQTYSRAWEEFAERYCLLKDTYWYPVEEPIGQLPADYKMEHRLKYYQWACMFLTSAAVVFMSPKFFWKLSQSLTDVPILYFCQTAADISKKTPKQREHKVIEMAELLECKLSEQHSRYSMSRIRPIIVYACTKILYLLISIGQFVTLGFFLGRQDIFFWGIKLAKNIYNGISWEKSGLFPRITFCDFTIREMAGNNRGETIQCMLGLNEFNEKIFLFIWFWLVFTTFVTFLGLLYTFFFFYNNILAISLLSRIRNKKDRQQKIEMKKFANEYLKNDGQLVLSFVKSQSDVVAQELACKLWLIYKEKTDTGALPIADSRREETDIDAEADIEIGEEGMML